MFMYSCIGYRSTIPEKPSHVPEKYQEKPRVEGDVQTGVASWYGVEEHNNRAASGERFDKNELTAAHKTLPMDTIVRVTNLENGKDVVVRINDRGPFVKDRIIDLSYAAAEQIDMLGPGTASVKVEVISTPNREENYFDPKYIVQVGSFKDEQNATKLKDKLAQDFNNINIQEFVLESEKYYRVRIGGFDTRQQAEKESKRLKKLGYKPAIKLE
jgi:rare lipoprotein A